MLKVASSYFEIYGDRQWIPVVSTIHIFLNVKIHREKCQKIIRQQALIKKRSNKTNYKLQDHKKP